MRKRIESLPEAMRIVRETACPQCDGPLEPTPSGGTCPSHRIVVGVRHADIARAALAKHLLSLPLARPVHREGKGRFQWALNNDQGRLCRRVHKEGPEKDAGIHAAVDDLNGLREYVFVPLKPAP